LQNLLCFIKLSLLIKFERSKYGGEEIGDVCFIQISIKKPNAIIYLEDNPVPHCLIEVETPREGWNKIPPCP